MTRPTLKLTLTLALLPLTSAFSADWPQYHGIDSTKTSAETIGKPDWGKPNELWKVETNSGFSSFTVADGRAYTVVRRAVEGIDREVCIALDAKKGTELWQREIGLLRYGHDGGNSGARGNKGGDGPRSTPSFSDGKVYTISSDLALHCLDAKSGKVLWSHDIMKEFGGRQIKWENAASPLIEGDHVYLAGGGKGESLLAFNKQSGKLAWKTGDEMMTHATPIAATIHGVRQVIFFTQSGLVAVTPDKGAELWRYQFPFKVSTAASPVVWEDIVYCGAGYGVGSGAVKISKDGKGLSAEEIWRLEGDEPVTNHWATPLAKDGYLYGMFGFKKYGDGPVKCVEIKTGEVVWEHKGFGPGNLVLAGDTLVALTDSGELVLFEATVKGYNEIARAKVIGGKCWSTPVIANGHIFARSTTEGVCIKLK